MSVGSTLVDLFTTSCAMSIFGRIEGRNRMHLTPMTEEQKETAISLPIENLKAFALELNASIVQRAFRRAQFRKRLKQWAKATKKVFPPCEISTHESDRAWVLWLLGQLHSGFYPDIIRRIYDEIGYIKVFGDDNSTPHIKYLV